ncbi:MAG: hypothetical protein V2A78_08075 [bacterium]
MVDGINPKDTTLGKLLPEKTCRQYASNANSALPSDSAMISPEAIASQKTSLVVKKSKPGNRNSGENAELNEEILKQIHDTSSRGDKAISDKALRFSSVFFPQMTPYPRTPAEFKEAEQKCKEILDDHLTKLPSDQHKALELVRGTGVSDVDITYGSHIVVEDKGKLYKKLSMLNPKPRVSSHYPEVEDPQFGLTMNGFGSILFGKAPSGDTWFQLEAHGAYGIETYAHILDFVLHLATRFTNVGPLGMSPCREKFKTEIKIKGKEL